jgi:hypothetical protein
MTGPDTHTHTTLFLSLSPTRTPSAHARLKHQKPPPLTVQAHHLLHGLPQVQLPSLHHQRMEHPSHRHRSRPLPQRLQIEGNKGSHPLEPTYPFPPHFFFFFRNSIWQKHFGAWGTTRVSWGLRTYGAAYNSQVTTVFLISARVFLVRVMGLSLCAAQASSPSTCQ